MKTSWRLSALLAAAVWMCSCSSNSSEPDADTETASLPPGGWDDTDVQDDTAGDPETEPSTEPGTALDSDTSPDSASQTSSLGDPSTDDTGDQPTDPPGACVFRVSTKGSSGGDGLFWPSAFDRVSAGLAAAAAAVKKRPAGERCQVWVAKGVHYIFETNWDDTARLRPRVDLLGGFSGDETGADERDADANLTVLDGHRSADDWTNQVLHVVTGADDSLIEGFTISGGYAAVSFDTADPDNYGGGMVNDGVSPTIRDCVFTENAAAWDGALANLKGSEALIERCTFSNNIAQAIFNNQSSVTITDCVVVGNHGGGISSNGERSRTTVRNAVISGNRDYGVESWFGAVTTVANATVVGNYPGYDPESPAGATTFEGVNELYNSILWSNGPGSVKDAGGGQTTVGYSDIDDESLAGVGNIFASPLFIAYDTPRATGSWTAVGYDPQTGATRLVDEGADWTADALVGLFLRLETNQESGGLPFSPIMANDGTSVSVRGDLSWLVEAGRSYALLDLRLSSGSPCVDAADGDRALPEDITGQPRHDDPDVSDTGRGSPSFTDMGAYERSI